MNTAGIILAGGQSRRMNGPDKALMPFGAAKLIDHIVKRLAHQLPVMALNSNNNPSHFHHLDIPVIPDDITGYAGPLAGILAGMEWAAIQSDAFSHIMTVATDTPFFPDDLAEKLGREIAGLPHTIAIASSAGRLHPVFGLWPISSRHELRKWLADDQNRRVMSWIEVQPYRSFEFPLTEAQTGQPLDPFFNINTQEDILEARQRWAASTR
ncbi:molybdenum cofactor guanylyltransferase MobA [Phyllobacterium sp. SB3]|uniref:molybdenum cofactor guanylyltransferase MobA n=1 Tax=Phyllobacterium sp. SB3 TaxID=3156073 RepID=UPI0032AEF4B9